MKTHTKAAVMSIRVPAQLKKQVNDIAKAMTRRQSDLLISWISEKVEQEEWQLQEINKGLEDLESGNIATPTEVKELNKKWGFNI